MGEMGKKKQLQWDGVEVKETMYSSIFIFLYLFLDWISHL